MSERANRPTTLADYAGSHSEAAFARNVRHLCLPYPESFRGSPAEKTSRKPSASKLS